MKVRLLWLVTVLVLGGLAGLLVTRDPGYVLVAYDRMAVETSLWFGLLALAAGYLLVRLTSFVVLRLTRGRGELARWNAGRRARAADQRTLRGLLFMATGHWAEARKQLTRAAPQAGAPAVNLLTAARAAERGGDREGRDALLRQARALPGVDEAAVDFTQAELEQSAGQWAESRVTLERLHERHPAHAEAVWLLADALRTLGDWPALAELLPLLKRDRSRPAAAFAALERAVILGRLTSDPATARKTWEVLPKSQRHVAAYAGAYAATVASAHPDDAERAIREALQDGWSDDLVALYGRVESSDPARQLATAESWLRTHPEDAVLFLCLGRVCLRNRRWPQAREHFELSVRLAATPENQGELGRLYAALGEVRALDVLLAAIPGLPPLPLPAGAVSGG